MRNNDTLVQGTEASRHEQQRQSDTWHSGISTQGTTLAQGTAAFQHEQQRQSDTGHRGLSTQGTTL